jgi:hypothetical protein
VIALPKRARFDVIYADPFRVQIALFRKFSHLQKEFPKAPQLRLANAGCVMWVDDGRAWFALIVPRGTPIPTIAHECVHAADFVMDHANVPAEGNSEVRAYLMQHTLEQVLRFTNP